jgi:hypothetical protein
LEKELKSTPLSVETYLPLKQYPYIQSMRKGRTRADVAHLLAIYNGVLDPSPTV